MTSKAILHVLLSSLLFTSLALAEDLPSTPSPSMDSILNSDLASLMDVELSIAGKKPQRLLDTPAAVYVLTQEDLRRSGVTSIPEALRLVPGFEVNQIDGSHWAVSARGFNGLFANKLLVLIDGRSVYTTLYAGVFWDEKDLVFADVERIEVIRGPGASVWGANAVNGVVNIVTKRAQETQGLLAIASIGTEKRASETLRYGGALGEDLKYRLYGKFSSIDDTSALGGGDVDDSNSSVHGGFRSDYQASSSDAITLQGDGYKGRNRWDLINPIGGGSIQDDGNFSGGNVLAKWDHSISDTSIISLQFYWDKARRDEPVLKQTIDTLDFSLEHRLNLTQSNKFNWGINYRHSRDNLIGSLNVDFPEQRNNFDIASAFVQDEQSLIPDKLSLTIGSKFDHNTYSGFQIQPTVRLLYSPQEGHALWAAISRAIRNPSRAEDSILLEYGTVPLPDGSSGILELQGNPDLQSESMISYEAGYRGVVSSSTTADIALYYSNYSNYISIDPPGAPELVHDVIELPTKFSNNFGASAWGVELSADCKVSNSVRLIGGFNHRRSGDRFQGTDLVEGGPASHLGPETQGFMRAHFDLADDLEFDAILRATERIRSLKIPAYAELTLRVGYRISENLSFSLVGQNLLNSDHQEYTSDFVQFTPTEIQRGVYGRFVWKFK